MEMSEQNWALIQGKVVRTNQAPQEEESKEPKPKLYCKACCMGFKSKNKLTAHRKTIEHQTLQNEYIVLVDDARTPRYLHDTPGEKERDQKLSRIIHSLYYIPLSIARGQPLDFLEKPLLTREQKEEEMRILARQYI